MENILHKIDLETAKKIFDSKENAEKYLMELNTITPLNLRFRNMINGNKVLDMGHEEIWKTVISSWDYEKSLKAIRNLFKISEKYMRGKLAEPEYNRLIQEWEKLNLGPIKWPCSQGAFDQLVQHINNSNYADKDERVKIASIRYRRMKELNTLRNDFIEIFIFEKHSNILPTFTHRRGLDYFINGLSFDQKVSKSPTSQFKDDYGEDWKDKAVANPGLVAEYLYKYQDEGRFGADRRILIVYLDDHIDLDKIKDTISKIDLTKPLKIKFDYDHRIGGSKSHEVECFVIVLSN